MEIERQRGISVATSVMGFEYEGRKINILDTPGHEDFAEDTYRTLTAVDSVIIVIDGAKGVEAQTRKLMEVCRMRSTPVIVFINKLDRPAKEPFDLLDEVEKELHIRVRPLAFPISNGPTFKGVYNLYEKQLSLFTSDEKLTADASTVEITDLASAELDERIGAKYADQLRQDVELIEGVYDDFDRDAYLRGELAPVFFGSAVNNFGVRELLECFIRIAPSPRPATTETRTVELLTVNDSAARESELSRSLTNSLLGLFSSAGWKTGVHAANAEEAEDGTRYAYRATDYCSPGKSILVDAVRRLTGRSERALASEGASDLDKLLNSYDENRMAAVAERLEKGYSDSGSKAEADKLAAEKSSLDKFAEGLRSALTLLDDLDEDDFGLDLVSRLIELVGNDYIDLGSAIRTLYEDVVAGALLGGDIIEEFMDSLEDLFEDMIDLYEEDVREFALTVARETNEWKSEMLDELASFFD